MEMPAIGGPAAGRPAPDLLAAAGTFNQVFTRIINHCVTSLRFEGARAASQWGVGRTTALETTLNVQDER